MYGTNKCIIFIVYIVLVEIACYNTASLRTPLTAFSILCMEREQVKPEYFFSKLQNESPLHCQYSFSLKTCIDSFYLRG